MSYPHLDWLTAKENRECQGAAEDVRLWHESIRCVGSYQVHPDWLGFRDDRGVENRIRQAVERNYIRCARAGLLGLIWHRAQDLKLSRRSVRNCDERPWVWGDSTPEMRARFEKNAQKAAREMIRLAALVRKLAPKEPRIAQAERGTTMALDFGGKGRAA